MNNYNEMIGLEYITQKVYKSPIWSSDHNPNEFKQKSGFIKNITLNENGYPSLVFGYDGSNFLPDYVEVYFNQKETCKFNEWHEKSKQIPSYFLKDNYVYTITPNKKTKYKIIDVNYYGESGVIKCKEVRNDENLHPTSITFGFDQVYMYDVIKEQYYTLSYLQEKIISGEVHV